MKDFIQRVITQESDLPIVDCDGTAFKLIASRSRNTNGHASIRLSFGKQTLELTSDVENYELVALEIAAMLTDVANNPCLIPKVEGAAK